MFFCLFCRGYFSLLLSFAIESAFDASKRAFQGVTSKKAIRDESYIERVLWMKLPLFLKRKSWMLLATSSATTPLLVVDVASRRRRRNNTKVMTTSSSSSFQMGRDTLRVDFELPRESIAISAGDGRENQRGEEEDQEGT